MPKHYYDRKENEWIEPYDKKCAKIAHKFSVDEGSCENPQHFTDYLLYNALIDAQKGLSVTFVLVKHDENDEPVSIMGYVALKTSARLQKEENGFRGEPAVEISELAVSRDCKGRGIGAALLNHAVYCCKEIKKWAGVRYLLVYAEKNAENFYKHTLKFLNVNSVYEIPHETWNASCIPMYLDISNSFSSEPVYASEDEENE